MASQKIIFNIFVVVFALCILSVFSSPIPSDEAVAVAVSDVDADGIREAKFYGSGISQASALAAASSGGGFGGYPGFGSSNSLAVANAASNSFGGYPYGK